MGQEIIKSETGLQKPFEPHESKIIELALKRKIVLYEALDAVTKIKEIILYAYSLCRFNIEDRDLAVMSGTMYEMLLEIFPAVTLEEFKEAAKKGVLGEYEPFNTLSVKTFMGFINAYLRSSERLHKLNKYKEEQKKEESKPPSTIREWKELVLNDYRLLKEGDERLIVFVEKKYLLLLRLHLIKISEEEWAEWMHRGKEELEFRQKERAKRNNDNDLFQSIAKISDEFEKGEVSDRITLNAQRLHYVQFLKDCIKNNIETIFKQEP